MASDAISVVPEWRVQDRIMVVRGQKVVLDADLAELYGVSTKRLNEQVKRNIQRFPADFMFPLTAAERDEVVANCDHLKRLKYSAVPPRAFSEHGAIMAASVLNTERAVQVSVFVVRAFVKLREMLSSHRELAVKLDLLEQKLQRHDGQIVALIDAIRHLMAEPATKPKPRIGFVTSRQQET